MDFTLHEYFLLYVSTFILLIVWFVFSNHPNFRKFFALASLLLLLIQGVIGLLLWQEDFEVTKLGNILSCTSPLWLTVPLMLVVRRNKFSTFIVPLFCIILPPLSIFLCFLLLAVTDQVWGL